MIIKQARPPNFDAIVAVFPMAANRGVVFCYGDTIYAPHSQTLPEAIVAHERVHSERQAILGLELWWDKYLSDAKFRYYEELLAHKAEYEFIADGKPRNQRRRALIEIAKKLSSPLYGWRITAEKAKADILKGTP